VRGRRLSIQDNVNPWCSAVAPKGGTGVGARPGRSGASSLGRRVGPGVRGNRPETLPTRTFLTAGAHKFCEADQPHTGGRREEAMKGAEGAVNCGGVREERPRFWPPGGADKTVRLDPSPAPRWKPIATLKS